MQKLFTIGFTKKSARELFGILQQNGITLVVDVRLNNNGQLAGYTKAQDLKYFLSLVGIDYQHWENFAPTKAIRETYHANNDFFQYTETYKQLLSKREVLSKIPNDVFEKKQVCLLCSEATPENCHRRLAAEWIVSAHPNLEIVHL